MSEPRAGFGLSVFAKLVLVMLTMGFLLTGLVVGFFIHFVNPVVGASVDRMLGDYASRIARDAPNLEEARRLAARLAVQIRYEGPDTSWSTDDRLPSIESLRGGPHGPFFRPAWGYSRYVVAAPNGGHYLFAWEFGQRTRAAHDRLLFLLLASMIGVFLAAYVVMSRGLRPLRALQEGVQRLSAGDLDVVLENRTRDEFGTLTAAFNRMVARVKEMVTARDQLLMDVSHELRSPLTRLKVALALLPDSNKKEQAERDTVEMETLIAGLLEFERLRDPRALAATREDLVGLLRDASRSYEDVSPGVSFTADPPVIPLTLDANGIRTVLRNLLDNATKYSLPDSRPVEVAVRLQDAAAVITVRDDGPGIPESDRGLLFEPFFRVDRSRSRRTGGYGLGLGLCKRIVEAHGGRIEVLANPGRGATFRVWLPDTSQGVGLTTGR
jgi:signal transduction histidine kinase